MVSTQANRLLEITTALEPDALLLTGFAGVEAMSQLFEFHLEMLAEKDVPFDRIVGQEANIEVRLGTGEKRYIHGMIKSLTQGSQDETFLHYQAELGPKVWLLSRNVRSRIFQQISVPGILREALNGFDVKFELNGTYPERDFCVQYGESDFAFISRLMEEEGIYYFFKHSDGAHQMVVSDALSQHEPINEEDPKVKWGIEGSGGREEWRIWSWKKSQQLRAGEYTLWDHCFEFPGNSLEAKERSVEAVPVGAVSHKLALPANRELEIYEFPGGYAGRFDGVDRNGTPRPADIAQIFQERTRVARLRMQAEECASLLIQGAGDCALFSAGRKFCLERHFCGDGEYLLTRVEHKAKLAAYDNDTGGELTYANSFTCIPETLPYRPARVTPKPMAFGVQTATVAGPQSEEMFTDKYGRVKVHFHWDREGKKDASSSCWVRVSQVWAGNGWGAFFWPRIGHEVIVAFENGDPDQPVILGSVYNAENLPPFPMPLNQEKTGLKSASLRGSASKNFNAIVFHDEKDNEHVAFHSERHMVFNAEWDKVFRTGRSHGERVPTARTVSVGGLPIGGGGGGGSSNPQAILAQPHPQGILGLNSAFTYGANVQVAVPLNLQVAVGSNLQVCVNPSSFSSIFTGSASMPMVAKAAQLMGSGMGGNMQCTLGTSANLVIGQSFDINVGPRRIQIDCHNGTGDTPSPIQVVTIQFAIAIQIATAVLALGYTIPSDEWRRVLLVAYQLTLQILLQSILNFQDLYKDQRDGEHSLYEKTFVTIFHDPPKPDPSVNPMLLTIANIAGLVPSPTTSPLPTLESEYPGLASVAETSAILEVLVGELALEIAGAASPNNSTN